MSNESDQIVQAVTHLKKRWLMSQPVSIESNLLVLCLISGCAGRPVNTYRHNITVVMSQIKLACVWMRAFSILRIARNDGYT